MFYMMNMVDYHVFFPVLSTLTWDTLLTLEVLGLLSEKCNTTQTF